MTVGILFLVMGGMNINKQQNHRTAGILNNVAVGLISLITLVNVIISGMILVVILLFIQFIPNRPITTVGFGMNSAPETTAPGNLTTASSG